MGKAHRFLLVGAISLFLGSFASAAVFNLSEDFSITNGNPNGVWTYGGDNNEFNNFTPYNLPEVVDGMRRWRFSWSAWEQVWRNDTTESHYGVDPGQISLHPGYGTNPSIVRFTAPASGEFHAVGAFLNGGGSGQTVTILYNAGQTNEDLIDEAPDKLEFDFTYTLMAGDTLSFAVSGYPTSGNTPLNLEITGVPEPGALALLGLGGLALLRRRARA